MSVAVLCNLSDGVVIGVDSALTVVGPNGVEKVFEDGAKLFQLRKQIGVATYGLGGIAGRSIGSLLYEFEGTHAELQSQSVETVAESLRAYFYQVYTRFAESVHGKPFEEITDISWNNLGLVIVGYSPDSFLSEAWEVKVPENKAAGSAVRVYGPGEFGLAWFASSEPVERYMYGMSLACLGEIADYIKSLLGRDLDPSEIDELLKIRRNQGYSIMTDSMPIQTGISYVRFLVNYVITHYKFTERHPIVGGKAKIGVITYKREDFQILE